jgi:hypothetical protein
VQRRASQFDPLEIVGPQEALVIESPDDILVRVKSGEVCNNWS